MSAIFFRLGLSEKKSPQASLGLLRHGLAAFLFFSSSVRWTNGDKNPLRGKYERTGAAFQDLCVFFFSDQNSVAGTRQQCTADTCVGIHTCACPRVKGTLGEHERTCALNAWWAIPLILPSIHLLPHPCSPSYFQSSPSLNDFILWSSRNEN